MSDILLMVIQLKNKFLTQQFLYYIKLALYSFAIFLIIFLFQFPLSLTHFFQAIPLSFVHPGEGEFWPTITPDNLQMLYLIWAAGKNILSGDFLLEDKFQFANNIEIFTPLVTDPLVYLGGVLSLFLPLAASYNLAFIFLPSFFSIFCSTILISRFSVNPILNIFASSLLPLIPLRTYLMFQGQHIAFSCFVIPLYFLGIFKIFISDKERKSGIFLLSFCLLFFALSEEHLAYHAGLFGIPVAFFYLYEKFKNLKFNLFDLVKTTFQECYPLLLVLLLLTFWAKYQHYLLIDFADAPKREYEWGVVVKNSKQVLFPLLYENEFGFSLGLLFFAFIPILFIQQFTKEFKKNFILLYAVFSLSLILSVGHWPWFKHVFSWEPYQVLYKHFPYFNMQRYSIRMAFFGYSLIPLFTACGINFLFNKLNRDNKYLNKLFLISCALFLIHQSYNLFSRYGKGQYYDVSYDPNEKLHATIKKVAGKEKIILRLPAYKGNTFEDTRSLLDIIYTGSRFYNGYFSYSPKIYNDFFPHFIQLTQDGIFTDILWDHFQKTGVAFLLLDRNFIKEEIVQKMIGNHGVHLEFNEGSFVLLGLN